MVPENAAVLLNPMPKLQDDETPLPSLIVFFSRNPIPSRTGNPVTVVSEFAAELFDGLGVAVE